MYSYFSKLNIRNGQGLILTQKSPSKNPMPIDFEEMEFTIENEEWNEYELKDGARIRGRIILNRIIRDPYNPNVFSFDFSKPVWVVSAPTALRGEPNLDRLEKDSSKKFEVHVNRNHERRTGDSRARGAPPESPSERPRVSPW